MTWKEFKDLAEKAGVKDHHLISWIDVMAAPIEVKFEEKNGSILVNINDGF